MNKINKYILSLLLMILVSLSSCDQFLDVNEDPVNPTSVSEAELLTGIEANFSFMVLGGYPVRVSSSWMGYTTYPIAQSYDDYYVTENDVNNTWAFFSYTPVMNNCKILVEQAVPKDKHYYAAIAKIIWAYNTSILTDMFGDIPFTQALDPIQYPFPAYDDQEVVYENIQRLLDEAIAHIDNPNQSPEVPGADDLILNGDMQKWKKLAYSLKGRYHMRLMYAPGKTVSEQCQLALAALNQGLQSNDDNVVYKYSTDLLQENPWNQYAVNGRWNTFTGISGNYAQELSQGLVDLRLLVHIRKEDPTKDAFEQQQGGLFLSSSAYGAGSPLGVLYADPDSPLPYMLYSEVSFLKAEASYLLGNKQAAKDNLIEGVLSDFDFIRPYFNKISRTSLDDSVLNNPTIMQNFIDQYMFSIRGINPADDTDTDPFIYQLIAREKYIAGFLTMEPYNDYRRYKDIVTRPATGSSAEVTEKVLNIAFRPESILKLRFGYEGLPYRFPYPSSEWQYNSENVGQQGVPLGFESMTIPVWWDTTN